MGKRAEPEMAADGQPRDPEDTVCIVDGCGGAYAFDPLLEGVTVGGNHLIGWLVCDRCGGTCITRRAVPGGAWRLATSGRSIDVGGIRLRAEGGVSIPLVTSETEGAIAIEVAADVLAEIAARQPGPRRRSGQVDLGSIDSLIDYVNRFGRAGGAKDGDPGGAVAFAPVNPPGITAILDYHPAGRGTTAWCEERATYRAQFSRQWLTWTGHEGKPLGQVPFGDFIEANQRDLRSGAEGYASATTMIQVARNLVINSAGKFQRTVNPTTGEGTLVVKDEHDAATSTKIPSTFALAIPVFEGDDALYPVEALLRFTMANGTPQFAFLLQNKAEVLEFALAGLRTKVAEGCGIPVFVGNPPPAAR